MKRWSKEEQLLNQYYRDLVKKREPMDQLKQSLWKEVGAQLLGVSAGFILFFTVGRYFPQKDVFPYDRGTAVIQVLIKYLTI